MSTNLLIQTASPMPRVVLFTPEHIIAEISDVSLAKTESLLGLLANMLQEQSLTFRDINAITFINGPGSFTGLRIGSAIVSMWHYVTKKSVYTIGNIPFLDMLTHDVPTACILIGAGVDSVFMKKKNEAAVKIHVKDIMKTLSGGEVIILDTPAHYQDRIVSLLTKGNGTISIPAKNIQFAQQLPMASLLQGKEFIGEKTDAIVPDYLAEPTITVSQKGL